MAGDVKIRGGVAYVTQQAWIQNMTLKENILFGENFDEEKYLKTIKACALEPDLKQLVAGDQVCIGTEKARTKQTTTKTITRIF